MEMEEGDQSGQRKRSRQDVTDDDMEAGAEIRVIPKRPKGGKVKRARAPSSNEDAEKEEEMSISESEADLPPNQTPSRANHPRPRGPAQRANALPPTYSRFAPPRSHYPAISSCRSVYAYKRLNHIEEGSYGVVFRAQDLETGDIVALKKLKLDEEKHGFPITSLREIMALMVCKHENVVGIREVVVGDTLTQVFIVMDFIEHDLKTLLTVMPTPFLMSEIKTLVHQLLSAVAHCHANWVLHRDLKTSNLLMNNRGQIKVADFGLARKFGDPLGDMTQLVHLLTYVVFPRAPELLLGETVYSTAVDVWSVGCVFGELLLNEPLFQAKSEIDMLSLIFKLLGTPTEEIWPGFSKLPLVKTLNISSERLVAAL
ncbi:hypothetical protein M407DRAFT_34294 [Tulasnella calospora MUT 4182]|uniref:cyclin-dependent kinase n=1 Tax=Tulasnella calospora MUT 4182 TaxID=1051891 RepID=A0A0C3L2V5_9AGAM|nr:hypothetical protein M407DRAFT_34294 [Tulasnella calospora MUT 4182]